MTLEINSLASLRIVVDQWRQAGQRLALVPTMGALHAGHMALVAQARAAAARVVVSIFVNPTQFGPNEDFSRYPRPLADDLAALRAAGADAAWLPAVETMYPEGFCSHIHVAGVSAGLCGAARPGHFDGVATVVAKLFHQVRPDSAFFGEKDYQQLCVIRRMVTDMEFPVKIVAVPTQREADGLALSSRNRYLNAAERACAPILYATLRAAAAKLRAGADVKNVLQTARQALAAAGFSTLDYLELRAADTLASLTEYNAPARLFVAAWLGSTRLIDNIAVENAAEA